MLCVLEVLQLPNKCIVWDLRISASIQELVQVLKNLYILWYIELQVLMYLHGPLTVCLCLSAYDNGQSQDIFRPI